MKFIALLLGFVASTWFAQSASANPFWAASCEGCTNTQRLAKANTIVTLLAPSARATSLGYRGFVYVYDLEAGLIYEYGVRLNEHVGGLQASYVGPALSDIQSAFNTERSTILTQGADVFVKGSWGWSGFPEKNSNALDIAQFSAEQNDISDFLMGNSLWDPNQWALVNSILSLALKDQPITITIAITLYDGSQVIFSFKAGTNRAVLTDARDQYNNTIPISSGQVPGSYRFRGGSGAAGPFVDYLHNRFGINVSGPTCVNGYLACTTGGSDTTCEWVHCN